MKRGRPTKKSWVEPVPAFAAEVSVKSVLKALAASESGAVCATRQGKLCGLFTVSDLVTRVLVPENDVARTRLEDVMSSHVESIAPDFSRNDALALMKARGIYTFPVTDEQLRVLGVVRFETLAQRKLRGLSRKIERNRQSRAFAPAQ